MKTKRDPPDWTRPGYVSKPGYIYVPGYNWRTDVPVRIQVEALKFPEDVKDGKRCGDQDLEVTKA